VGEIKSRGDGSPGEISYFNNCNEMWQVEDPGHLLYGKEFKIFDETERKLLEKTLNKTIDIITGGGIAPGEIHHIEGKTLKPWQRDTLEYIVKYKIPAWFGTISGEIVEK